MVLQVLLDRRDERVHTRESSASDPFGRYFTKPTLGDTALGSAARGSGAHIDADDIAVGLRDGRRRVALLAEDSHIEDRLPRVGGQGLLACPPQLLRGRGVGGHLEKRVAACNLGRSPEVRAPADIRSETIVGSRRPGDRGPDVDGVAAIDPTPVQGTRDEDVTGVAERVTVPIGLVGVRMGEAVVAGVPPSITIQIDLIVVPDRRAIVLTAAVSVLVGVISRNGGTNSFCSGYSGSSKTSTGSKFLTRPTCAGR